jgi:hypothetical protein
MVAFKMLFGVPNFFIDIPDASELFLIEPDRLLIIIGRESLRFFCFIRNYWLKLLFRAGSRSSSFYSILILGKTFFFDDFRDILCILPGEVIGP